jgi:hypothetical protein
MKKQDTNLLEKRAELKQIINEGMQKTFPANLFNATGRSLVKIFRLKTQPDSAVNIFVFSVCIYLVATVAAALTGEIFQWTKSQYILVGLLSFEYLSVIIVHLDVVENILPGIRDTLVDSILTVDDLRKLENWLNKLWSFHKGWIYVLFVLLFVILNIIGFNFAIHQFIGVGLAILAGLISILFVAPIFIILYMLTLPVQISGFHLTLYETDPVNSEVIQQLIRIFNLHIYLVTGMVAIGTALIAANPLNETGKSLALVNLLAGWFPIIAQFLMNQYALRRLIARAKWLYLNQLQTQIKQLQNTNLITASEKTLTRLNQLIDLHDRISAKSNSSLNWGTGLSFFNQLMLPLLGLLLGNIDKVWKFLTGTP